MDRRSLLATTATLAALFGFRGLRGDEARAAETFEITKTPEEWKKQLTPMQYHILREEGTERPGASPLLKEHRKGNSPAPAATCRYLPPRPSSRAAPAGPASTSRCRTRSASARIPRSAWCAPKCTAAAAAAISATSSTTARSRPACAIA